MSSTDHGQSCRRAHAELLIARVQPVGAERAGGEGYACAHAATAGTAGGPRSVSFGLTYHAYSDVRPNY